MITEHQIRSILTHVPQYVTLRTAPTDAQALIAAMQRRDEMLAMLWRERHVTAAHYGTYLWSVGAMTWRLTINHRRIDADELIDVIADLLLAKQAAYGQRNPDRYGVAGVVIRMSDKVGRLESLHAGLGAGYAYEASYDDTLDDLLGYAVLGLHMIGAAS